jgi:hypothetical protein
MMYVLAGIGISNALSISIDSLHHGILTQLASTIIVSRVFSEFFKSHELFIRSILTDADILYAKIQYE